MPSRPQAVKSARVDVAQNLPAPVDARTRLRVPGKGSRVGLFTALAPALAIILLLFCGGLFLGLLQSLGLGMGDREVQLSMRHYINVFTDADFFYSLALTFYIALTSTLLAAAISLIMAITITSLAEKSRIVHFIFQIPLTVPHLVIAIAVVFMLSPTGLFSRLLQAVGVIEASSQFPLLVNDAWGIGIILAYAWKEVPFITLMIISALRQSGAELLDVGRTLNANRWQRYRFIVLPIVFPSLGAACLIVFAYTFGAFEIPFLLGQTYPMMLPVWAYKNFSDIDLLARPEGIATGIVIAVVVIACVVLSQLLTRIARERGVVL